MSEIPVSPTSTCSSPSGTAGLRSKIAWKRKAPDLSERTAGRRAGAPRHCTTLGKEQDLCVKAVPGNNKTTTSSILVHLRHCRRALGPLYSLHRASLALHHHGNMTLNHHGNINDFCRCPGVHRLLCSLRCDDLFSVAQLVVDELRLCRQHCLVGSLYRGVVTSCHRFDVHLFVGELAHCSASTVSWAL